MGVTSNVFVGAGSTAPVQAVTPITRMAAIRVFMNNLLKQRSENLKYYIPEFPPTLSSILTVFGSCNVIC
jgi:hypothetical protein